MSKGNKKSNKSAAPVVADFSTEDGKHYKVVSEKVIIPGMGLLTKEELLQSEEALAYLVANGCSAIAEVDGSNEEESDEQKGGIE
jgi:hypothetical protein